MSTIRVNAIQSTSTTDGGISIDSSGHVTLDGQKLPSAGPLSNRNKIINGDMRIDQRNAGASVTSAAAYTLDRWIMEEATDGAASVQQSTTTPSGFRNSLLWTTTTADASLGATQYGHVQQRIEGFNSADLEWGTANARTVTLSFWVRSSLTGTFSGSLRNDGQNRCYPFTYTISSADTFEYKTVTIPGDTTGTWVTNNGVGIRVGFSLGTGSTFLGTSGSWTGSLALGATGETSVMGTLNATWYITGVQLEVGSVATPFEHRSYGDELRRCERYFQILASGAENQNSCIAAGGAYSSAGAFFPIQFPVMRAAPSLVKTTGTDYFNLSGNNANDKFNDFDGFNVPSLRNARLQVGTGVSLTQGVVYWVELSNTAARLYLNAEL